MELVGLTFLLGCFLDKDTDIWFHLRAGREMLSGGGIPRTDSYIFAANGAEWIDLHWGFQLLVAWLFSHGGFAALTLMAATAAAVAMAIALASTTPNRSVMAIVWCWLPGVFVMSERFYPRPEILSLVCLGGFLWVLESAAVKPQRLWLLVPIQLVWVNVHGLFVLGPVVLGCWLIDRIAHAVMSRERQPWHFWCAPLAVILVCFANPYTWKGVVFPLTLFQRMSTERDFYGQHIGELLSIPDVVRMTGISSVYLRFSFLLLVASAASFALRRFRFPFLYYRGLLFVLFAGVGLLASRNQPQFAMIATAVLAWNVGDWILTRRAPPLIDRAVARILTSALLVGLMLWVITGGFYAYAAEGRRAGLGEQPFWYAHDAAKFAARKGMPRHFVAYHEGQSAVLEFHMRPDQRVFVDPRLEVSPRKALEQYYDLAVALALRQPSWPERLAQFPQPLGLLIDHASHHAVEATLLADPRWRCIWFDAVAGIYVPAGEIELVKQYGVDFGERYFGGGSGVQSASESEAENLLRIGRDLLTLDPPDRRLGRLQLLLAAAEARGMMAIAPRSLRPASLLAGASLSLYDYPPSDLPASEWQPEMIFGPARARYFLNQVVHQTPSDFQSWLALFAVAQTLGDPDAAWVAGGRLAELHAATATEFEIQRRARVVLRSVVAVHAAEPPLLLPLGVDEVTTTVRKLIDAHRFTAAREMLERSMGGSAGTGPLPWELADLRARLYLLGGDPQRARTLWEEAPAGNEHRADKLRALASSYFVEGRLSDAAETYRSSLASGSGQSMARYGLAIALLEAGEAAGFIRECDAAVASAALPQKLTEFCRDMRGAAEPHAPR